MAETIESLGKIIADADPHRDAVHVAVAPVVAAVRLAPGQEIGLLDATTGEAGIVAKPIGIVDPFLKSFVLPGQKFWLWLYPGSISSLRHEWVHPAFTLETKPVEVHKVESEDWIRHHAEDLGLTYRALMEAAEIWVVDQEHTVQQGRDNWRDDFNPKEFWHHYHILTGKNVSGLEENFFCCSC